MHARVTAACFCCEMGAPVVWPPSPLLLWSTDSVFSIKGFLGGGDESSAYVQCVQAHREQLSSHRNITQRYKEQSQSLSDLKGVISQNNTHTHTHLPFAPSVSSGTLQLGSPRRRTPRLQHKSCPYSTSSSPSSPQTLADDSEPFARGLLLPSQAFWC